MYTLMYWIFSGSTNTKKIKAMTTKMMSLTATSFITRVLERWVDIRRMLLTDDAYIIQTPEIIIIHLTTSTDVPVICLVSSSKFLIFRLWLKSASSSFAISLRTMRPYEVTYPA